MSNAPHVHRCLAIHPIHAVLLASALPLFLGAALTDWAYSSTFQVQWINFSSWLITGALFFAGFALLWSLIELVWRDRRTKRYLLAVGLLLATWIFGLVNALIHTRDGWAVMPEGPILSVLTLILALAAISARLMRVRIGAEA